MSCQVIDVFITSANTNFFLNSYFESNTDNNQNKRKDSDNARNAWTIICAHDRNMLSFYDMEDSTKDSVGAGKIQRSVQLSSKKANDGCNNCGDYRVLESYNDLCILRIAQMSLDCVFIECMAVNEKSQLSYIILSLLLQPSLFVSQCYLHVEEFITRDLSTKSDNTIDSSGDKGNGNVGDDPTQLPNGCLIFESQLATKEHFEDSSDIFGNNTISYNGDINNKNTNKNTAFTFITYGEKGVKMYKSKQHPSEHSIIMSQSTIKFNQLNKNNSDLFLALCDIPSFTNETPEDINEKGKDFRSTNIPLQSKILCIVHIEKGFLYSLPLSSHVIDIIPIDVDRTLVGYVRGVDTPLPVVNNETTSTPATATATAKNCEGGASQIESETPSNFDFYATQLDSQNSYSSCHIPITPSTMLAQKLIPPINEREIIPDSPYNCPPSDSLFDYDPFSPISSIPFNPILHYKNLAKDGRYNECGNGSIIGSIEHEFNSNHEKNLSNNNKTSLINLNGDCRIDLNDAEFKFSKRKRSDTSTSHEGKRCYLQNDDLSVDGKMTKITSNDESNIDGLSTDCHLTAGGIWKSLGDCLFVSQDWNTSSYQCSSDNNNENGECDINNDQSDCKSVDDICYSKIRFDYRLLILHLPATSGPLSSLPSDHSAFNGDTHNFSIHSHRKRGDNNERDDACTNKCQAGTLYITPYPLKIIQPKLNLTSSLPLSSSSATTSTSSSTFLSPAASLSSPLDSLSSFHFSLENDRSNFNSQETEQTFVHNCTTNLQENSHHFSFTPKTSNFRAFCGNNVNELNSNKSVRLSVFSWSSSNNDNNQYNHLIKRNNLYDISKITQ
jgi:hypothetical protein